MGRRRVIQSIQRSCAVAAVVASLAMALPAPSRADEGGISFWVPGLFGSLAALPGVPGWAFTAIYYHASVDAGADANFPRGGRIDVGIKGQADLGLFGPTYIFATPVLGGQFAVSLFG